MLDLVHEGADRHVEDVVRSNGYCVRNAAAGWKAVEGLEIKRHR
jgi:hypothetical protein